MYCGIYRGYIYAVLGYIDVNIVGGNGIKNCLDIQIYDNSGNFKCSTRDRVYLLVKFVGEDVTRFYACNHISEKYDVKTIENMLDDIEYYKHPKLYLKGTEFELYRRNITNAMAHDLKSPLMVVSGYVQNILENTKPEKNEYYLTSIQSTVDYMDKMIGNILDLSKSESMTKESYKEMVDMRKLILDCAEKYAGLMEKGKLTFTVSGELRIWCDRAMMNQAIDNIVGNAVKYAVCDSEISVELRESGMTFKNHR